MLNGTFHPYTVYFYGRLYPVPPKGMALVYYGGEIRHVNIDNTWPTFLGATVGHSRVYINCDNCDYVGIANFKKHRGSAYYLFGLMTLGVGACFGMAKDTHHYCPTCGRHVAYAKLL